jgi:hypothetical protein
MATTTTSANSFLQRLIGALALDIAIYEEVEADRSATGQALAVVLLSSLAAGFGSGSLGGVSLTNILFICTLSLLVWAAWALLTYEIGVHVLPEPATRADVGELLRTLGFAATPGFLRVFAILPGAAIPTFIVTSIWMLATMVVAVRQALDYTSTARAIAVCVLGWVLATAIAVVIGLAFGPTLS